MVANGGSWKRELLVAALTLFCTVMVGLIGWATTDRLHWAGEQKQIEIDSHRLDIIEHKIDDLPQRFVTAEQHAELEHSLDQQHVEIIIRLTAVEEQTRAILAAVKASAIK